MGGNPRFPMWSYGWWLKGYKPDNGDMNKYNFRTPKGFEIILDESGDKNIYSILSDLGYSIVFDSENEQIKITKESINITFGEKLHIEGDGVNLIDEMVFTIDQTIALIDQLALAANIVTPAGPGQFQPPVIIEFQKAKTELGKNKVNLEKLFE
jgi:hypothetical protein